MSHRLCPVCEIKETLVLSLLWSSAVGAELAGIAFLSADAGPGSGRCGSLGLFCFYFGLSGTGRSRGSAIGTELGGNTGQTAGRAVPASCRRCHHSCEAAVAHGSSPAEETSHAIKSVTCLIFFISDTFTGFAAFLKDLGEFIFYRAESHACRTAVYIAMFV